MTLITESASPGTLSGSRMEITLITPGWGSSGYYSAETLAKAAQEDVFPRGTQMHIDHMTASQRAENPAGSVATLAAALTENARWEPDWTDPDTGVKGRLAAEARVFPHWRETLAEMAEFIGASISAPAEVTAGEAEGRQGTIVESLLASPLNRVDFVTVAGRGGHIAEVLESHRVVDRAVDRGVEEATANNTRQWLQQATDEAHGNTWVRDFDESLVWFERYTEASVELLQQSYTLNGNTAVLSGDTIPVKAETSYVPVTQTDAAESKDSAPNPAAVTEKKEVATVAITNIEESELATLRDSASRATALEEAKTAAETRAATAEESLALANTIAAEAVVAKAMEATGISGEKLAARLALNFPVLESGVLDREKLAEDVAEALAEIQSANGVGSVRGVGESFEDGQKAELTNESYKDAILAVRAKKGA
ncbi:MAG: hypothetical protein ABS888_00215 [Eubacteriales bacterium]